ncbi:uncharacterized protein LOC123301249 [Chrysoperla carnea]|uniref:uncharacterized protein LOC123301249 n=1 Tax=Chrysoperla carnea TaxID=189513 RepID=UPI001D06D58C|nr:uncharacterized protein LOC123301249 [Chrysoperla carnea]
MDGFITQSEMNHVEIEEVFIKEEEDEGFEIENHEIEYPQWCENEIEQIEEFCVPIDLPAAPKTKDTSVQVPSQNEIFNHNFMSIVTHEDYIFLTGFNRLEIQSMFFVLRLHQKRFSIYEDFLFICLAIYRHNIPHEMASCMFKMEKQQIADIFVNCTNALYETLKNYDFWKHRLTHEIQYTAIFNCVEIPVAISQNPMVRKLTNSHTAWNRHTFKFLVVTDERGFIVFCSDLYGGCTSGRHIVMSSNILDKLRTNEVILSDKEFIIHDILSSRQIGMDVALFINSKSPCCIMRAYQIAQSYEILKSTLEEDLWYIANRIVYNCYMLANFKKGKFWTGNCSASNLLSLNSVMNLNNTNSTTMCK